MKHCVLTPFSWLPRRAASFRRRVRERHLKRLLKEQSTESYWRRRESSRSRRLWLVANRYHLDSNANKIRENISITLGVIPSLLGAFAFGGILFGVVLVIERGLAQYVASSLIPTESVSPLGAFPTLAVQVTASLLGFYLASVSIVLGTSYRNVSADVRAIVLGSTRTRLYLKSIGMAIGAGLTIVLLGSIDFSYGYLTISVYALLIMFSGWAFAQLASRAFDMFNPIVLKEEPLRVLYRALNRLGSKGLSENEAVLRATARQVDRALRTLAELITMANNRATPDRDGLAQLVVDLLVGVQLYAYRKHLVVPTSEWFLREPVYPKWIETDFGTTSMAVETATPLQPRMAPVTDWLEKRSAELVGTALAGCVRADSRDATLRITRAAASTAHRLAERYHLDEAIMFAGIIRDRCRVIQSNNNAAVALAAEPPLILASLLLGWREAITSWPEEIRRVVAETAWGRAKTKVVQIHGSARVRTAAQTLLREVQAEHAIEGRRRSPDWYLQSALSAECVLSLREFAEQLPLLVDEFVESATTQPSPVARAMAEGQALQALSKAQLVCDTIAHVTEEFDTLRVGHGAQPIVEMEDLAKQIRVHEFRILASLAVSIAGLRPEHSQSAPDLFGQTFFTLIHYTEYAIANGNIELLRALFPSVVSATLVIHEYARVTYVPPTYEGNSTIFDFLLDILELSGLAIVYEALRHDSSAELVRQGWAALFQSSGQPEVMAKQFLDILDLADGQPSLGITPRDYARTQWEIGLTNQIVGFGYAQPEYVPFDDPPRWNAPRLIKMLGVSEMMPSIFLRPRTIFAVEVIAPWSGEAEETLRARPGLRKYYEESDILKAQGTENENDGENDGEGIVND